MVYVCVSIVRHGTESFDYGYYDEGSEGLKVAVVHHLDMPIIRQRAFHVAPGTENQVSLLFMPVHADSAGSEKSEIENAFFSLTHSG